ncbi:VanW family protein [Vermiculatibacterium agrestimuris]|uniref:VanW family protein n=1 Tax=Vermiculatibacterium agrestimuris TaxID=2941519 RepID=UPI00203A436B|nr:VanW family protein [Vermiculatibacterium agrestimuris]
MDEPKKRSKLRAKAGALCYGAARRLLWLKLEPSFAKTRQAQPLSCLQFRHATPMLRQLKDVDMELQRSKVHNLTLAAEALDGILIRPGETFSYWYLIGNPCRRRGFTQGMILRNDTDECFQLLVRVGQRELEGAIWGETPPALRYEIVERGHEMRGEYWGGYTRHSRLVRLVYDLEGRLLCEEPLVENHAVMMYSPYLEAPAE